MGYVRGARYSGSPPSHRGWQHRSRAAQGWRGLQRHPPARLPECAELRRSRRRGTQRARTDRTPAPLVRDTDGQPASRGLAGAGFSRTSWTHEVSWTHELGGDVSKRCSPARLAPDDTTTRHCGPVGRLAVVGSSADVVASRQAHDRRFHQALRTEGAGRRSGAYLHRLGASVPPAVAKAEIVTQSGTNRRYVTP
jgi:hypothetical protein